MTAVRRVQVIEMRMREQHIVDVRELRRRERGRGEPQWAHRCQPEIDSDSTEQRRIGEHEHPVEVDEHGRVTEPFQRDVVVRPGCGIRRLRGWQYVSCRPGAAERWPSRQDQPPRRRGTHVGSCALY